MRDRRLDSQWLTFIARALPLFRWLVAGSALDGVSDTSAMKDALLEF